MELPLENVRVLDFSQAGAAPYGAALLAEFGADVVHIEPPGGGSQRYLVKGTLPANVERNKRSIVVNLKDDDAIEVLEPLISSSDVILHNYRPGKMEKLGLDYESIRDINDGIVYCSLTGYGSSGELKDRPAFDPLIQAKSGLMAQTGEPDRKPSRVGTSPIDFATGTYSAYAISLALREREKTGKGQKIETSLYDTGAALMGYWYTYYSKFGNTPERHGHTTLGYQPVGVFDTGDKPVYIAVPGEKLWTRFCEAIDKEEWLDNPKFATEEDRIDNFKQLHGEIADAFEEYTRAELTELLVTKGVPAAELQTVEEAAEDPHLRERGSVVEVEDVDGTDVLASAVPIQMSETPPHIQSGPPELGEHTDEILLECGFSESDVSKFKESDVVE